MPRETDSKQSPEGSSLAPGSEAASGAPRVSPSLELIARLCQALAAEGVRYCHWKSTTGLDRAQLGEGDLDLLIDRRRSQRFEQILYRLGFKKARAARELSGVFHAFGLDEPSGRLVHIHAHYALVLGDDMTKNYRLPVEDAYLASAAQGAVFRVPAPEFELAVLVIRLVLKHAAWDSILIGGGRLSATERRELQDLTRRVPIAAARDCVRANLAAVGESLWEDCLRALGPGAKLWFRIWTARRLEASLAGCARRPWAADTLLKLSRRVAGFLLRRVVRRRNPRLRLDSGGALIAIVGGDDYARSRAVAAVHDWFARDLEADMLAAEPVPAVAGTARPPSTRPTLASLARVTLRARARRRRCLQARRMVLGGTLLVCDGFPARAALPEDDSGTPAARAASVPGALLRRLARRERAYVERLPNPDVLIVLCSDRSRAGTAELAQGSGSLSPACVVESTRSDEAVLAEIKCCVWSSL